MTKKSFTKACRGASRGVVRRRRFYKAVMHRWNRREVAKKLRVEGEDFDFVPREITDAWSIS